MDRIERTSSRPTPPRVGLIGWRGMVGSVLLHRMRAEHDFAGIDPVFFSTSQAGTKAPDVGRGDAVVADATDLEALSELDVVISCQGGDYTTEIHPKLRAAGFTGHWIDAASTLRMSDAAVHHGVSACSSDDAPSPVVLGAVYNLSGGQESLDQPSWNGAQLAAAQINAAGGVLGRPLSLLVADGETDAAVLAAASARLLDRDVSVLFGLSDTDAVLAAAPPAAAQRTLFLTSGSTSPRYRTTWRRP